MTAQADEQQRMQHFVALSEAEKLEAIKQLARSGLSIHGVARAAGISVEAVRAILHGGQCDGCSGD